MITLYITDCQWGAEPIDNGIQINLLEESAQIMVQVPFSGEALKQLAILVTGELSPVQLDEILKEQMQKDVQNKSIPEDRQTT